MKKVEDHVKKVVAGLKLWVPDMWKKEQHLTNVCDEMVRNILSARKTGKDAMTMFFTQFTTTGADVTDSKRAKHNYPIKKQKIYTFNN